MGDDLWVFIKAGEEPVLVLENYYDVYPVINTAYLQQSAVIFANGDSGETVLPAKQIGTTSGMFGF